MYQKLTISVVLPCLNEERGVGTVISKMPTFVDEVIVIDNGSVDKTGKVAKDAGAKVIFEKRKGYGRALKAGIYKAKCELIITMDGDGTYNPASISKMVDMLTLKNLDFVSGNRFNSQYKNSFQVLNLLGNKILTIFTNIFFGQTISDSQSGMMLFKKSIVPFLVMESLGMSFSEEVKINVLRNKSIKFAECAISYRDNDRLGGRRLRLWRDGFYNLYYLFKKRFTEGGVLGHISQLVRHLP